LLGRHQEKIKQRELKLEKAETNRAQYWEARNNAA